VLLWRGRFYSAPQPQKIASLASLQGSGARIACLKPLNNSIRFYKNLGPAQSPAVRKTKHRSAGQTLILVCCRFPRFSRVAPVSLTTHEIFLTLAELLKSVHQQQHTAAAPEQQHSFRPDQEAAPHKQVTASATLLQPAPPLPPAGPALADTAAALPT
jgi:hypothetical protein